MNNRQESITLSRIRETSKIYDCVKKGFGSLGDLNLDPHTRVVIKPNLCCIKSCETGATTDPCVVEGIVRCLQDDYGVVSIFVVESDASQMLADMAFKLLGYEKLSKKMNVTLVNLSKSAYNVKDFPQNAFLKRIKFPRVLDKPCLFISVPKIKTHGPQSFTCVLKNQFGCNPNPNKSRLHKRLDDAIVDLNVAFKPDLIVVDGIIAMGGYRGPVDGVPIRMNTLIFGRDPVAVDHLVSRIIGVNANSVKYLVEAKRRGIGTTEYVTTGSVPLQFQSRFRIQRPRLRNLYNVFRHSD